MACSPNDGYFCNSGHSTEPKPLTAMADRQTLMKSCFHFLGIFKAGEKIEEKKE
jgi:hypothetical protein